ncbi:MAG: protein translocase subunit SecF, partial [Planctomycetia bacterium]|nr:protein translocase subunit SecF [Planctomycetia bacterium]
APDPMAEAAPAAPVEATPAPVAEPTPAPVAEPAPAENNTTFFSRPMEQMLALSLMAQTADAPAAPVADPAPAVEAPTAPAPVADPAPAVEAPAAPAELAPATVAEVPAAAELPATEVVEAPATETAPVAEAPAAVELPVAETAPATEAAPAKRMEVIPEDMISVKVTFPAESHDREYMSQFIADQLEKQNMANVAYKVTNMEKTIMTTADEAVSAKEWLVHVRMTVDEAQKFFTTMKTEIDNELQFPAASAVGSAVASNMCYQGLMALVVSLLGIVLYIWVRFQKLSFGLSSTTGLIHNIGIALALVTLSTWVASFLGFLLIDDFKISLTLLAAFLTLIGYSLNDTIVVFDRIRENRGKGQPLTKELINKSLNSTLARTIMTSLTTFIVALALYIFGGESIHGFAFVMTVGIVVGTYSTIFIAAPLLYLLANKVFMDDLKDDDDEE